jgi:hypothetical protein
LLLLCKSYFARIDDLRFRKNAVDAVFIAAISIKKLFRLRTIIILTRNTIFFLYKIFTMQKAKRYFFCIWFWMMMVMEGKRKFIYFLMYDFILLLCEFIAIVIITFSLFLLPIVETHATSKNNQSCGRLDTASSSILDQQHLIHYRIIIFFYLGENAFYLLLLALALFAFATLVELSRLLSTEFFFFLGHFFFLFYFFFT